MPTKMAAVQSGSSVTNIIGNLSPFSVDPFVQLGSQLGFGGERSTDRDEELREIKVQLLEACVRGDSGFVKRILDDHPAWVNVKVHELHNNRPPLLLAAEAGHFELVEMLIDRGADIMATGAFGHTFLSAGAEDEELVEFLLPRYFLQLSHVRESHAGPLISSRTCLGMSEEDLGMAITRDAAMDFGSVEPFVALIRIIGHVLARARVLKITDPPLASQSLLLANRLQLAAVVLLQHADDVQTRNQQPHRPGGRQTDSRPSDGRIEARATGCCRLLRDDPMGAGVEAFAHALRMEAKVFTMQPLIVRYMQESWRGGMHLMGEELNAAGRERDSSYYATLLRLSVVCLLNVLMLPIALPLVAIYPPLLGRSMNPSLRRYIILDAPAIKFSTACVSELALALVFTLFPASYFADATISYCLLCPWLLSGFFWEIRQVSRPPPPNGPPQWSPPPGDQTRAPF